MHFLPLIQLPGPQDREMSDATVSPLQLEFPDTLMVTEFCSSVHLTVDLQQETPRRKHKPGAGLIIVLIRELSGAPAQEGRGLVR